MGIARFKSGERLDRIIHIKRHWCMVNNGKVQVNHPGYNVSEIVTDRRLTTAQMAETMR